MVADLLIQKRSLLLSKSVLAPGRNFGVILAAFVEIQGRVEAPVQVAE